MAQKATPNASTVASTYTRGPQKKPAGNARMGNGQGNTDHATVQRLLYYPPTDGMSRDSRYRDGSADDSR